MKAFDVFTGKFESVPHISHNADSYRMHKHRKHPYQSGEHASRVLFEHTTDKYIVWVVGAKFYLMLRVDQIIKGKAKEIAVGNFINAYQLDRTKYVAAFG